TKTPAYPLTAHRKTCACAPALDPAQPSTSHTKREYDRPCQILHLAQWPRELLATIVRLCQRRTLAPRVREMQKYLDRHKTRPRARCKPHRGWTAALSPHGRADRCTPAAFVLRTPAAPSAQPRLPPPQSRSDLKP